MLCLVLLHELSAVVLIDVMLSAVKLSVFLLTDVMQTEIMLSTVKLSVFLLNGGAPFLSYFKSFFPISK
jgi:hypothetical protein